MQHSIERQFSYNWQTPEELDTYFSGTWAILVTKLGNTYITRTETRENGDQRTFNFSPDQAAHDGID